MARILVDLSEEDVRWLDALAARQGRSRAAVLREAVGAFRDAAQDPGIERFFGIWRERAGETGE